MLAPGEDGTCTATYEVTQADVNAGSVQTNVAAVSASDDRFNGEVTAPDAEATPVDRGPGTPPLKFTKTVDAEGTYDTRSATCWTYTLTASNDGNVEISDGRRRR